MEELIGPSSIIAAAALLVALAAFGWAIFLSLKLRALRAAQVAVLGSNDKQDLVEHAAQLQAAFKALDDRVEEAAETLDRRTSVIEQDLTRALTHRSLVRYDAYGELSGHQSTTVALLDTHRNGVVLSAIVNRESARLYCKQVVDGRGEHELSPEENQAIENATTGAAQSVTLSTA